MQGPTSSGTSSGNSAGSMPSSAPDLSFDKGFLGHPRGLATLFFTEMWERFSFYGMRALLVLYMTTPKDLGGLGFDVPTAGAIYGLYTSLVYMTAVPGGILADRFLGLRKAVVVGGLIIMAGHISMAIPSLPNFFLGLGLIIIGTGLLKPNISSMVGGLYGAEDSRRDGGFSIFYMGINLGAMFAPLACGYLAQDAGFQAQLKSMGFDPNHSWHWGFAAAAVGMGLGLVQFLYGTRFLGTVGQNPAEITDQAAHSRLRTMFVAATVGSLAVVGALAAAAAGGSLSIGDISNAAGVVMVALPIAYFAFILTRPEWTEVERKRIGVVSILFFFSMLFWAAFEQAGSSLTLFADRLTLNQILGYTFPSSWFQSVNSIFIIALAPAFSVLWVKLGDREPSSPAKFAYGLLFVSLGFLVVAFAAYLSGPEQTRVPPHWLVTVYLLHTIGELCLSPVGLSMVTKLAPARAVGQLMGVWFLSISLGNYIGGRVAGLFESFPLPQLFGAVFLTAFVAAGILAMMTPSIRKLMGGVH